MNLIDRRIGLLFVAFVALLVVGVARATYLGTVRGGELRRDAATQQIVDASVPAPRGTITDRNGVELAISVSADDVIVDPFLIKQPQVVARQLAPWLNESFATVLAEVTKPHTGFVYLAHQLPAARANAIQALSIDGVSLIADTRRVYPQSSTAAQVIGGVYENGHGSNGIEYRYDNVLSGRNGLRRLVRDAIGQTISVDNVRPAVPGKNIELTIDAQIQQEVEQVLAGVGTTYSPKSASAIVMNPDTGAILALANWPSVNANDPGASPASADEDSAVELNYEPGSTFKAITVSGALQEGLITPQTTFDIPPELQVADRQIHDAEDHGYETLTTAQILQVSSNIGADLIGITKLGPQRFDYWVHRFGFGSLTGVDLPGEEQGIVLHWWQYSGSSMGNLPMGQGESVTLMQMATAYAAIANGGILRPAHVAAAIGGKALPTPAGHRIISPQTALEVRKMLRGVFADGGTASGAAIPGYDMAGKTGTANIAVDGQYSDTEYVASFIGMVPTIDPKLLVAVMVNQPQGSIYGGAVAAPAFQKIVGWTVPYLGINPCPSPCQSSTDQPPAP